MPPIETLNLNQYAILWEASTLDEYGSKTVESPVEIKVRWEHSKGRTTDNESTTIETSIEVYVDRDIDLGSIMRLGRMVDLPDTPDNLKIVVGFDSIPDLRGKNYQRLVLLEKFSNTLPSIS